jgi:hypothetical protein
MNNKKLRSVYKLLVLISCILMVCCNIAVADEHPDSGDIKYLKGPLNVEDMLPLGDTQWLVTSGLNGKPTNKDHNGHIYLINHKEKTFEELFPGASQKIEHDKEMFNACPRPINHNSISFHGLDLKQQSSGLYHLYVINHGEREAIEVFNVDVKGTKPAISWAGCVMLPKEVMANSVTILPDGGFLTTNYFDPTNPNSRMELIQGKISGAVYEWHPGGEVKAIKGTELSGPNGITLSPDNEWVYLTAFGKREIIRFNRTKSPITMERVKVGITPDNIRWGDDGMLYTVGNNHVPPEECQNPPCRAGWSVYSVHPYSLKLKRIFSIDQTAALQNGTTALVVDNEIWVGTFAGDMIAYFPKP